MNIQTFFTKYPQPEAEQILSEILGLDKASLFLQRQPLTPTQTKKAEAMMRQFKSGKPLAYILGFKYFYGLKFEVDKHTLIPRPETEGLVDYALEHLQKAKTKKVKLLDLGTGSGCISISIAKNSSKKKTVVYASDISVAALKMARRNAKTNKTTIRFVQSNLFENISGKFDVIVANLPYVPVRDYKKLYKNLKHEPKSALTDGTNSFILLERFLRQANEHLHQEGFILMEIDPAARLVIEKSVKKYLPAKKVIFIKDLSNLLRFAVIF